MKYAVYYILIIATLGVSGAMADVDYASDVVAVDTPYIAQEISQEVSDVVPEAPAQTRMRSRKSPLPMSALYVKALGLLVLRQIVDLLNSKVVGTVYDMEEEIVKNMAALQSARYGYTNQLVLFFEAVRDYNPIVDTSGANTRHNPFSWYFSLVNRGGLLRQDIVMGTDASQSAQAA